MISRTHSLVTLDDIMAHQRADECSSCRFRNDDVTEFGIITEDRKVEKYMYDYCKAYPTFLADFSQHIL